MYDILFGSNGKGMGVASSDMNPQEMADKLHVPIDQVYRGVFKVVGTRFVKSPSGKPYCYWTENGPIDIATIALLSETADSQVYFFKKDDQPMGAFLEIDEAQDAGYTMAECVDQVSLTIMIMLTSCNIQSNKYVVAINKYLKAYTTEEDSDGNL